MRAARILLSLRGMRGASPISILALFAAPLAAHAGGGYVSAGIGSGAGLGGQLSESFQTEDNRSARFSLGQRVGPVAVEASLFGAGMVGESQMVGVGADYDTLSVGVDLKYYFTLAGPLELYPKAGLNKTWLLEPTGASSDYDGTGWDLGGGLQFTFDSPVAMAALWLDFTHQRTDLRDSSRPDLDGQVSMLTLGLSLGI